MQQNERSRVYKEVDRRKLFIAVIAIVAVVIVGVVIYAVFEVPKTSVMVVGVGPKDAEILIDGKRYKNQTYKMKPGVYHVTIEREGYQTQEEEIVLEEGKTGEVRACLIPNDGDEWWWSGESLKEGENGYYCQAYYDMVARLERDKLKADNKIFSLTPYKNYTDGYTIAAQMQGDGKVKVIIALLYCKVDLQETSKELALEWMRGQGLNPESYEIEIDIQCEDLEPERW